jgi:hypothetical protein
MPRDQATIYLSDDEKEKLKLIAEHYGLKTRSEALRRCIYETHLRAERSKKKKVRPINCKEVIL